MRLICRLLRSIQIALGSVFGLCLVGAALCFGIPLGRIPLLPLMIVLWPVALLLACLGPVFLLASALFGIGQYGLQTCGAPEETGLRLSDRAAGFLRFVLWSEIREIRRVQMPKSILTEAVLHSGEVVDIHIPDLDNLARLLARKGIPFRGREQPLAFPFDCDPIVSPPPSPRSDESSLR